MYHCSTTFTLRKKEKSMTKKTLGFNGRKRVPIKAFEADTQKKGTRTENIINVSIPNDTTSFVRVQGNNTNRSNG